MFPWFNFFNKLLDTMVGFHRHIVSVMDDSSISDKQKVASIKMYLISHEDDLVMDFAQVIEDGLFKPKRFSDSAKTIVNDKAFGVELTYSLN